MTADMAGKRSGESGARGWKTAALIVAVTAVGYFAATVAEHVPRQLSGFAPASGTTYPGAASAGVDTAPGAPAAASVASPAEQADYFPDHYVNHATRVDEQPATF